MSHLLVILVSLVFVAMSFGIDETYDDNTAVVTETLETHKCKTNEVWMECGTCENKCGEPRVPCPRMCKPPQCQCPPHKGFRRDKNGDCVKCD
ncbi:hypothetical protein Y032_0226g2778 [Ancylostoma ceylanicum]|uniref:Trypsin Inhibitor like cysteine rich domain protein n=1 Tax=Ancylostoma ceylanicum TaxID=53326 RepID=A0A016SHV0_9BILA|nr:hypothetical protein Y032_0226g2778 [Ancylostoma ceylanicum]